MKWTESNSELSQPFLSISINDAKHFLAFWSYSFQEFVLEGRFKAEFLGVVIKAVPPFDGGGEE